MANVLTFSTTLGNTLADAVDTAVGAAGTLEFATSADAEVATLTLANPAFGDAVNKVITLDTDPVLQDTNANAGTMAKFFIKNAGTTTVVTGTVGVSGEAINFSGGVVVEAGDTVELTSFTITF
jgi:hypothetical protein